jgi:Leucine-rich repeat (LRR) protein
MSITGLETLVNIKRLDLSYNRIRKLDGLDLLLALEWLDLKANSLSNIDEITVLSKVQQAI